MRHRKAARKLGRTSSHRKAMLRNMMTSLFKHEQLETTDAKAKELKRVAEKVITLAKRGDLHARRQALARLQEKGVTHRLFEELKSRFADRQGGYVRITKKGMRKGDGAPVSIVQLLPAEEKKKPGKEKAETKAKAKRKEKPAEEGAKKEPGKEEMDKKGKDKKGVEEVEEAGK
ncbi:MAG: 50S ribosomal protein L17 [Deltaproteobacteria bacterium]|nr:50S ribosomal protein L17 [Deltaproteobacteria bacterium]